MRRRTAIAGGIGSLLVSSGVAHAQTPDAARPLRLLIPFGPGSGLDAMGRALSLYLKVPSAGAMVVENREGAAGAIGARAAASAPPDGHTLLLAASPPFAVTPTLQKSPSYHPVQDFTPIARIAEMPMVLVASRSSPVGTFAELVAYAKAQPGKLDYASAGAGVPSHLFMEQLKRSLGLNLTYVPYKSTGQMYTDVISGLVPLATVSLGVAKPHLASGAWKALAIGLDKRHPLFPDIPTIREVSPTVDLASNMKVWYGLLGPKGLPRQTVDALYQGVEKAVQTPEFAASVRAQFAELALQGPREFTDSLASHYQMNLQLINSLGLAATL
ncbi:Bug family tripartite tricarboxylate transporter substrate binding protein [Hydrogenophaga sp. BPS33]|uniref:Bug family tripartite tricarboxylate transporter substrate binding protein n=1 Tax=Hydrogenophaga sp. BPS33 TaxID=2651974 RepID=UPI001358C33F|nr:tripartite tricarboxylate transporter substrate binding protein [Hydrogenophaga sp. BPS33]